jgi:ribosomal protein L16 Arg81 hydroxylase
MSEPITTFSKLLDPITVDEFFTDYYDQKALHIPGTPGKAAGIFSWEAFNDLLQRTAIWSDRSFKLALDGTTLTAGQYCEAAANRDGMRVMRPVPEKVVEYLGQGASIVLDLVETLSPGLRAASEAIQMATGCRVSCNIYSSQQAHQAFPSHFDTMDVFAIHIEGKKTWRMYEGRFDGPLERPGFNQTSFPPGYHDKAKGSLAMEVELNPGDLLYFPKGMYHDALSSTDNCLHLSFGTTETTGLDFMRWFTDGLDQAPLFRKSMPPHDDVAAHSKHIEALRENLMEILQQTDAASQFREEQRSRAFAMLSSVAVPDALSHYRVRGRGVRVVRRGSEWRITAPDGNCNMPAGADGVVEWMLARDHFERRELAAQFSDVNEQTILDILQTLSSVGVLEAL